MPATGKSRTAPGSAQLASGIALLLAAGVLLLYAPAARHELVILDDLHYISENPMVTGGLTWPSTRWAFETFRGGNWHPLTWLSHMLDAQLFGPGPMGPHLTNVVLHAANSALLFTTLRVATGLLWPSAAVAAFFAFHPLRVESVAWAAERKDVLSGFFWLLTMLAYVRYARRPSLAAYVLVFVCLTLGLMAKAMLVTVPAVLLLLDLWPLRRWPWPPPRLPAARSFAWLVLEKLPFVGLSVAASLIAVSSQETAIALQTIDRLPLAPRLANAAVAYVVYLRQTLLPTDLAVFYPHPGLVHPDAPPFTLGVIAALVLLAAVSVAVLRLLASRPYAAVGWFWYLGTALPVIGVVQVGEQAYADRYTYIPTIGIAIALVWGARDLAARWHVGARPLAAAAIALLALAAVLTAGQLATWQNSATLFAHAVRVTDDNYFAHTGLGNLLRIEHKLDDAAPHFERALAIKPDFAFAHTTYGALLEEQGRWGEAVAHQERALTLDPLSARAHANLGSVLLKQAKLREAEGHLEKALRLEPESTATRINLGAALMRQGRADAALAQFERALRDAPDNPEVHNNYGVALTRLGRLDEAQAQFETALRLRPEYENARRSLEWVRSRTGK